jgi:hypothetical protein
MLDSLTRLLTRLRASEIADSEIVYEEMRLAAEYVEEIKEASREDLFGNGFYLGVKYAESKHGIRKARTLEVQGGISGGGLQPDDGSEVHGEHEQSETGASEDRRVGIGVPS